MPTKAKPRKPRPERKAKVTTWPEAIRRIPHGLRVAAEDPDVAAGIAALFKPRPKAKRWTVPDPGQSAYIEGSAGIWLRVHCDDAYRHPKREAQLAVLLCEQLNKLPVRR